MTDAYWAEIARERKGDERKALACADPFTMVVRSGDDALHPIRESEPDPELQRVWLAALEWLPPIEAKATRLAYAESINGKPIGRAGQGVSIARMIDRDQSSLVYMLDRAEERIAQLAPLVKTGHTLQAVCRRVDALPLHSSATVSNSALVRAYASTWSTLGTAKVMGMSQSAVHARVVRLAKAEPVLRVIHSARKLM